MTSEAAVGAMPRRAVRCRHCDQHYAPAEALLCTCVTEHRSVRCPSCSRCACSTQPAEIRERYQTLSEDELKALYEMRMREKTFVPVPANLPRPLVVVADDNSDIRVVVKRVLQGLGYGVIAVSNGEDAWTAIREYRPEVALLDGLMPGAHGRSVAQRIKDDGTLQTKAVIMTSLHTSAAQTAEAFRRFGVDAYLTKPVKAEALQKTVEELAGSLAAAGV